MSTRSHVLAAIDFSSGSINALKWAKKWLLKDRDLILAHALIIPEVHGLLAERYPVSESLLVNARAGARHRLDDLRNSLGLPDAAIEIREGKPAEAIADIARSTKAELIVVGKHGETGPLRGYAGRTADSLVRSAPAPIIVANGALTSRPERVIVALTYSSITPHIVSWTKRIQAASGARIVVVHAIGSAVLSHVLSVSTVRTGEPPTSEEIDEIFSEDRDRWTRMLIEAGIPADCIDSEVIFGEVSTAVLGASAAHNADMIIMGSHAGPVRRLLLGSAASAVVREAEIPVMVVVEPEQISERMSNGILTVHLSKAEDARAKERTIPISSGK